MLSTPRKAALSLIAVPVLLFATACSGSDSDGGSKDASGSGTAGASQDAAACDLTNPPVKKAGTLTVGTDSPAFDPWFAKDDPSNGEGFESAVAYAVAEKLGFDRDQVEWVTVPFNNSYAPGEKNFDFDINQISITDKRKLVVDFSDGYYSAAQAVVTLENAELTIDSVADLADLELAAQTGTTSLTAITDVIKPATDPMIFDDTNAAKQALLNGQVEAIVADVPTAWYITSAEIKGSTIAGQFQPELGSTEEFGMLFQKGNPLVGCVNQALAALKEDGTLAAIEDKWLSTTVDVPVLK